MKKLLWITLYAHLALLVLALSGLALLGIIIPLSLGGSQGSLWALLLVPVGIFAASAVCVLIGKVLDKAQAQ